MDGMDYLRYVMALIFVLALMGGLYLILKHFGYNGVTQARTQRRLRVIEALPLDGRRRAILLRRDDQEHLVILGASGETVVETNIKTISSPSPIGPDDSSSSSSTTA